MEISRIIEEANELADRYNLALIEIDKTDNVVNLKLSIDTELFIQIYGNAMKAKLNLALIFKKKRLYGYDSEGSKYHYHPFDNPDAQIFVEDRKSIHAFVQESMRYLEEKDIL